MEIVDGFDDGELFGTNQEDNFSNLKLGFIKFVGEESDGMRRYELIFTSKVDEFYGESFNEKPSCLINDLLPEEQYIDGVKVIKTNVKLDLLQDSCCFSYADGMDGITSIAYENLDDCDEYPDYRLFFFFGENYDEVEKKLALKDIIMK